MIQDFSSLYKLSLAIGTSLNLQENIQHFLSSFIKKAAGERAAIWLNTSLNSTATTSHYSTFESPLFEHKKSFNQNLSTLYQLVSQNGYAILEHKDPLLESLFTQKVNNPAYKHIVYPLGARGLIILDIIASKKHKGLKTSFVLSIQDVINKFALSIEACLVYEQSTKETLRNEEKYRSIIENMELGLLEVTPEGKIIKAYPKFCKLTGYTEEELFGKIAADIFLGKAGIKKMAKERAARKKGETGVYEIQLKKKNGKKIWVMISGAPYYDENNHVAGSVGIHLDITERKMAEQKIRESQEKLQLILNTSLDAIFTIDETGKIIDWNPNAEKIFGYSSTEVIGRVLNNLIVPNAKAIKSKKEIALFMKMEQPPPLNQRIELTAIRKTGEEFPIELTMSPIKIQNQYFFSAFCRDITIRKKSEQALINAKKAAEQARNVERQFLAHMSHEIRTPMNAVIGMTYLLQRSQPTAEQKDYIQALKFSADSLMGIISDILDLSKIEAGEIELEYRPFSLHSLLESLYRSYQFRLQEKNISIKINIDKNIKHQVIGDKTRMGQILSNLLSNASKFTSEGSIGITALLEKSEGDTCWIKFQVSDTGIGISKENLGIIFSSFKQATVNTHREFGGTGLGLSIVKQLVELQNGTIKVKSELGKGTVFEVLLPFKYSELLNTDIKKSKSTNGQTIDSFKELTILIAEDNLINQKLITSIFTQWGIDFDLANNGLEAVEYARTKQYDMIFMDLNMPIMNGYEATVKIKKDPLNLNFHTPIVTLTAAALHEERKRMFEAGVYDFITKPFSPQQLQRTIISCLDQSVPFEKTQLAPPPVDPIQEEELYDLSHLNTFSQGNPQFVIDMVQLFLKQNPQNISILNQALDRGDWDKAQDLAHQLKSTLGTLGMSKQQKIAKQIEHNMSNKIYHAEKNKPLMQRLKTTCAQVYPLLKQQFSLEAK
ncbi:PAS domain-containing hybrid sensor histidine kinase/response regulator [Aureispira anguillae]|uniref:histidine kinase n=1 Tax=Aureispira anguillae TaxID=2864201 RepID=A0A916DS03_9BACT|nr:PAS domain-containing hybrid sensor histidine kinase/response regulator [Aureispira anguillae]BDS10737.1 PAS domain S-box protein [Aureispira anguillae]